MSTADPFRWEVGAKSSAVTVRRIGVGRESLYLPDGAVLPEGEVAITWR